ncbi:hypothetical protein F5Y17DRAFT_438695 [Xylariaceae sp. FL0594]|nr:hypothetical protein F5Y17DRAFT_438695 [Xylariaceae sp. FL0594]
MVSLWPWKGDDSSPALFEKTLSTLAVKITNTQAQLEQVRNNSRRYKLLLTLYLTFAYLVYAIVLTLVVGWKNLGPWEWTGMAGGPVLIYLGRTVLNAYYSFRLDSLETRLKDRQAERAKTIQKLKEATRYDSTLELLEKYGGTSERRNKPKKQKEGDEGPAQEEGGSKKRHRQSIDSGHLTGRTHLPPPPTANIQRPSTASGVPPNRQAQVPTPREAQPVTEQHQPNEEFAPNAGPLPPTYSQRSQYDTNPGPPRWYDRILDLMLGEDETSPKNRIVLICQKCRLVNGQAPPGVKSAAEIGTWKCMGCGATNGELDEGKKIMQEVLGSSRKAASDESGSAEDRDSDQSSDMVKVEPAADDHTDTRRNMQEFRAKRRDKKSQMVP